MAKAWKFPVSRSTSPHAGSDAGSIPDFGVVCKGSYTDPTTGEQHNDVLGIRISWEKRWITLAPVATVLGMAFKMYDPDGLLGDKKRHRHHLRPDSHQSRRCGNRPSPFPGRQRVYRTARPGAKMCLSRLIGLSAAWIMPAKAGRCWWNASQWAAAISLPANSVAAGKMSSYTTALYARIRDQFGLPIGKFEGVDEALSRIGMYTYQMEAAQDLALTALDSGEKPSVISAILKYHNTERMRKTLNDAMDIHGGRAVVLGPRNYLAAAYQAIPVAITVEGANILTRSMIIFGQGAIRCHPFVLKEMRAAMDNDAKAFKKAFGGHLHFAFTNAFRSFWLSLTNGAFTSAPQGSKRNRPLLPPNDAPGRKLCAGGRHEHVQPRRQP